MRGKLELLKIFRRAWSKMLTRAYHSSQFFVEFEVWGETSDADGDATIVDAAEKNNAAAETEEDDDDNDERHAAPDQPQRAQGAADPCRPVFHEDKYVAGYEAYVASLLEKGDADFKRLNTAFELAVELETYELAVHCAQAEVMYLVEKRWLLRWSPNGKPK